MLRTHSIVPFKSFLGMSNDEYERTVTDAQNELAEHGERAKVYIKMLVSLGPQEAFH